MRTNSDRFPCGGDRILRLRHCGGTVGCRCGRWIFLPTIGPRAGAYLRAWMDHGSNHGGDVSLRAGVDARDAALSAIVDAAARALRHRRQWNGHTFRAWDRGRGYGRRHWS